MGKRIPDAHNPIPKVQMALVGNFENFTDEVKQEFEEWTKSEEAKQTFLEVAEEVQRESDDFRERNAFHFEDLFRPFTI